LILLNPSIKNSTFKPASPQQRKAFGVYNYLNSLNADTFNRTKISFGNNASRQDIENFIGQIEQGSVSDSNSGWQAKFYKMNEQIGIKAPSPKYETGDIFGKNNIGEFFVLKHLNKVTPEIATTPADLIERKNIADKPSKYYLAMNIINGKAIDKDNLTSSSLTSIVQNLFNLEKEGIVHFDLQNENILIENNNKARIIDFGSFAILDNDGNIIYSESNLRDENPSKYFSELSIGAPAQQKRARNFISKNAIVFIETQKNNPYTNFHSNIQNFEYRTLHDILMDKAKTNPQESKDFFKSYLQTKAATFHSQMKGFLSSIEIDDFVRPEDNPEDIQSAKTSLQKAIRYEEISEKILENPTENVIKTELAKMQLRYFSAFTDKTLKREEVIKLHQDFAKTTTEYAKSATPIEKEYYDNSLLSMKSLQDDKILFPGEDSFSDEKNILKALFEDAKKPLSKPDRNIKKSNTKIYAIIAGVLAIGGAVAYFVKNQKELNHKPR